MARDKLTEYDATAANNTVVGDVNLAENSALPSDMNNAVREVMSHLKGFASGTDAIDALTVTGDLTAPNLISASDALVLESNKASTERKIEFGNDYFGPIVADDNNIDLGRSGARFNDLYVGGSVYVGGTAAANSLSHYEEGTFEPTFRSSDGDYSNIGYNGDTGGRYIKVGNLVYAQGCVRLNGILDKTNRSTNSVLQIGGLPFVSSSRSNGDNADGVMPVRVPVWPSGDRPNMTLMAAGTAQANLVHQDFNGISSNILTDDLNSTAMIHFTLMYTTN